jgi:hypothetical protein
VVARSQPKLLAQGKPRTLGGSTRPWRVRLYAPSQGSNKYQVYFKAPAGEGEPWKRVLRRAASEEEARKIFAQAEAALDTEQATPVGADVRASRTIRMLGEEYLKDSIERGKHAPATQATAANGMMHAWDFSKITIFRDVRNSAIIEKWPEVSAHSPCPSKGTATSPRARQTSY